MAKTDLLKEAIADAKAVRETALANAKIALEEAFTPRIQSMLSAKLAEEEGMEDEAPVAEEEMEEPVAAEGRGMNDADEDPTDVHSEDAHGEEEPVSEEMEEEPVSEEGRGETEMDEEEDLELEAIIKELEDDMAVEEQSDSSDIGSGDNKLDYADSGDTEDPGEGKLTETEGEEETVSEEEDEVSLDEIISALREEEGDEEVTENEEEETVSENEEAEKDLEEAYKVIRFLKSKINEVNLLNAKLLFSNKLFRNHSLNEGQKMKVIENFDRAQSLREVKLVFATLSESFNINGSKTKRSIKEGYASKSTRSTRPSKKVISEGNDLASRWKKLANL
jgi:flagellar biosynthesis/type III secretory pathway chaperone